MDQIWPPACFSMHRQIGIVYTFLNGWGVGGRYREHKCILQSLKYLLMLQKKLVRPWSKAVVFKQRNICPQEAISTVPRPFRLSQGREGGGGDAAGDWKVEARDAAERLTVHRMAPLDKDLTGPNADQDSLLAQTVVRLF